MAAPDATPPALNVTESPHNSVPSIRIRSEAETSRIHNVSKAAVSTNPRPRKPSTTGLTNDNDNATWGSNFWVTLIDPQVCFKVVSPLESIINGYLPEPVNLFRLPGDWAGSTETRVAHTVSIPPAQQLTPIPSSDASAPPSPSEKSITLRPTITTEDESLVASRHELPTNSSSPDAISRARAKTSSYISHRPQQPQSLTAALEKISISHSDNGHGKSPTQSPTSVSSKKATASSQHQQVDITSDQGMSQANVLPSQHPFPVTNTLERQTPSGITVGGKGISNPMPNYGETTL
ncbi:hypothetical protein C0992_004868 [Termitomyces sp. T32_za158]|nr:hypothetical protein C0992_004868 [Termitomyces sp. T32_za158]